MPGVAERHDPPRVPRAHDDVVVRREEDVVRALDRVEDELGFGRHANDLFLPTREAVAAEVLELIAGEAPVEAHLRHVVVVVPLDGPEARREEPQHAARAFDDLVELA